MLQSKYDEVTQLMTNSNIFKDCNLQAIATTDTAANVWNCTPQFVGKLTVQPEHLDEFNHTNNTIYLVWMQAIAALHSAQLGLTFQDFVELGYGCVARQHHLEYKRPTFAGDTLWIATWISHNEGKADMTRQYQFVRESDHATVMQGHTQWVCIDMKTGRPKKQPPRFVECYKPVNPQGTCERLTLPPSAAGGMVGIGGLGAVAASADMGSTRD